MLPWAESVGSATFPVRRLQTILARGNSLDLRQLVAQQYAKHYGWDHAFPRTLRENVLVNYYRIDSGKAVQLVTDGRPLILFLKPFTDDARGSAEENFRAYYGCGPRAFEALAARGSFLVTALPQERYRHPTMRELYCRLAKLEGREPVYANLVLDAVLAEGTPRADALLKKLGASSWPALEESYRIRVAGRASALDEFRPIDYLSEKLRWIEGFAPSTAWNALELLGEWVVKEKTNASLSLLIDATFVLAYLYPSPVNYSRGPSLRVSRADLAHWDSVLGLVVAKLQATRAQTAAKRKRAEGLEEAVGEIVQLAAPLANHVQLVAAGANHLLERWIPRELTDLEMEIFVQALERLADRGEVNEALRLHGESQKLFVLRGDGRLGVTQLENRLRNLELCLGNLLAEPRRLRVERSKLARAWVGVGGTVVSTALPATDLPLRFVSNAWKGFDRLREARIDDAALRDLNPAFQIGLDMFEAKLD